MRASSTFGLAASVVAAVATAGRLADIDVLAAWRPGEHGIFFLTGVLLTLGGASLAVRRRRVAVVIAAVAAVGSAAVLLEWYAGVDLGIDRWVVHDHMLVPHAGRPTRITMAGLFLASALVLLGDGRDRLRTAVRRIMLSLLLFATLVVVLAYVFEAHELDRRGTIPIPSAVAFVAITVAVLARTTYEPPLAWLWDRGTLGMLARRLLPATLLAPLVLGWLFQAGWREGLYSANLAMLLFTSATTAMLTATTVAISIAVRRAERKRDQLTNELTATFDNLPAAMSLRDRNGVFLRVNPAFAADRRMRPEDIVGKKMCDVYHRDALDWAQGQFDEVITTGEPSQSEIETDLGNGPRVFSVTRYPVRDHLDEVIGMGSFALDITERRRIEKEAASAAARVEAFLAAAPDAIIVVDETGVIRFANAQVEPMLGYTPEELVGERLAMLVPDRVRSHHHELREKYNADPTVRPMGGRGLTARHRDGHEVAVEISLGPAKTPEGNWTLAAIRDVTTRRAAEEKIRAAEARFREELDLAERIQRRLMPTELPQPDGWDLAVSFTPASHVGGDFYDCWMPDHDLRVVVADVMGKGVSAALVGSGFRVTVNSALTSQAPAEAVQRVARDMSADLTHTGRFVTCFAARIDPEEGAVHWVDAGHGLALVLRAGGGHSWLRGTDLPVGVLPEAVWTEHHSALEPGDMLVVVSDGLVDHFESADALLARLETAATTSSRSILDTLLDGLGEPSDDVTAFAIRRELAA